MLELTPSTQLVVAGGASAGESLRSLAREYGVSREGTGAQYAQPNTPAKLVYVHFVTPRFV